MSSSAIQVLLRNDPLCGLREKRTFRSFRQ